MVAIYARQSVDKADSLSIDSQIEACKRLVGKGEKTAVYKDKGWSGKNIHRPGFGRLLSDVKRGKIEKIIVYKLDRISRSLHDFSNLIEIFKEYGVEFASTVETFDTSSPVGRAMLGIIMVFAELERENILLRVKDNYYARAKKGMYLGGQPIFGFDKTETSVLGIKTSMLVPNQSMDIVRYMYEKYAESRTTLGDIVRYLNAKGIKSPKGAPWDSCKISRLLRSPTYVCCDMEVYRYFKDKGCEITSPVEEFTGEYGCYVYGKRPGNERKYADVTDHKLTLALHKGVISSDLWLAVQRKLDANEQIKRGRTGSYSWLTGLIKCGKCGYCLKVYRKLFYYCSGKSNHNLCEGYENHPLIEEVEDAVGNLLKQKFSEIIDLMREENAPAYDPKVNSLRIELETVSRKIENLVKHIAESSEIIGSVLSKELEKLIIEQERLEEEISASSPISGPDIPMEELLSMLEDFDDMPVEIKNSIARQFIVKVLLFEERIEIVWRF